MCEENLPRAGPGYWAHDMLPILPILHSTCVRQIIGQLRNRGKHGQSD